MTHAGFAAACWTFAAPALGVDGAELMAGTIVAVGAGVAPDLDEPQSSAARSLGFAGRGALSAARKLGGYRHRGPQTHSLLAAGVVAAAAWAVVSYGSDRAAFAVVAAFALLGFGVLGGRKHRARGVLVGVASAAAATWTITEYVSVGDWLPLSAGIGWGAHVVGDAIVGRSGVPILWPVYRGRLALGLIRVGGTMEWSVVVPAVYGAWAFGVWQTTSIGAGF